VEITDFLLIPIYYTFHMLTRQQKEEIVANLTEEIKSAPACVLVDFKGYGANDMVALKKEMRTEGAKFQVIKKKLLAIALKNNKIDTDIKNFDGQIAIAISQDETSAAKIIHKASKENENIKIVGGLLESKILSTEEMIALAKLPSTDELRGQLVGQLLAPLTGFVNVLSGNTRGLVNVLTAVKDAKEA